MIRTDIDIKDALYSFISGSELVSMVSGSLYKDKRPINSDKEDITIAVLARDAGSQIQLATVNVNIYIPDIRRGQEAIEDTQRLRSLSSASSRLFEYQHFGDWIITLDAQEIMPANGIDWHVINNRLRIRYNNE